MSRWAVVSLPTAVLLVASTAALPAAQAAPTTGSAQSDLRVGVMALAGAIAAVGQTDELAEPLPLTSTSLADVLRLDERLSGSLQEALTGTDLEAALDELEGVSDVDASGDRISFGYGLEVEDVPLELVHDDGDLRLGANSGAGSLDVTLRTQDEHPFVIEVDDQQDDPLLRVAVVSQPVMDLSVAISSDELDPFSARQGFTEVAVTGGTYRVERSQTITMRDPDGRSALTLEDLRYSTLPDLFRVETGTDEIDVRLDLALPGSLTGGEGRTGTLAIDADDTPVDAAWPAAADGARTYGDALGAATGLSMADGLTSLAHYTGAALALQEAADVPFPHLDGGTSDVFAPGDRLLDLLSSAAAANVACGAAPESPPVGVAAPGDAVYCSAVTPPGLGTVTGVEWTIHGDNGRIVDTGSDTVGADPSGVVRVEGSDGEPDLSVTFTSARQTLTARTMPRTVQDVVTRIEEIGGSSASASLEAGRLDVDVAITQDPTARMGVGNPGNLGTLVGLTGLGTDSAEQEETDATEATATATGASFDVGFGIETGAAPATGRRTVLLPQDRSLLSIDELGITAPDAVTDLPAQIGFLGVTADLTRLELGQEPGGAAVELTRLGDATGPLPVDGLLTEQGALTSNTVGLTSRVTAGIGFTATERALPDGALAVGSDSGAASGTAEVVWDSRGRPATTFDEGYSRLRVFDPVPATFLDGTASVAERDEADQVSIVTTGVDLFDALGVPSQPGVEVARRLSADGLACQNVTITDSSTLTCTGLAPEGDAGLLDGQQVGVVVLGDPFALRDAVVEGLAGTLSSFDRLAGDNVDDDLPDDQYASSLPLVDLVPAQLAPERDALAEGMGRISAAAAEDELGAGGSLPSVSSVQDFAARVPAMVRVAGKGDTYPAAVDFTVGSGSLQVGLQAKAPAAFKREAALRLLDESRGQVSTVKADGKPDLWQVGVTSTTDLAIDVDVATARAAVADPTGTVSTATLPALGASALDGTLLAAGIAALTVTGQGSNASAGVQVTTDYVPGADGPGELQTTRANAPGNTGKAATADLVVGEGDVITYRADATGSSGGSGTVQPEPDAMAVRYLAEGLDGLASALDAGLDGASARNLAGNDGAPVSAPLIGTDLDAGAGVAATLTALTSQLRTELRGGDVADAVTADDLEKALEAAVPAAINDTAGLDDVDAGSVEVTITCTTEDDGCVPCPEPEEADPLRTQSPVAPSPDTSTDADTEAPESTEPSESSAPDGAERQATGEQVTEGSTDDSTEEPAEASATDSETAQREPSSPETTESSEESAQDSAEAPAEDELTAAQLAEVEAAEEPAKACTTDGPQGWDVVTIDVDLSGTEKTSETVFDTGLAGLEVRSDYPVTTTTEWDLPITLELARGVGPRVQVADDGDLTIDVSASVPGDLKAIVGYLPAEITADATGGTIHTQVQVDPATGSYDLFDLYDGALVATPGFGAHSDSQKTETDGLVLDFDTVAADSAGPEAGGVDLRGSIDIPWTPEGGYGEVSYDDVALKMGKTFKAIATPFEKADPYLAPVRDVIDVLRTPIPVISDLSELAGGDEVSLLWILETAAAATTDPDEGGEEEPGGQAGGSTGGQTGGETGTPAKKKKRNPLELAHRVIGLVDGVTSMVGAIADLEPDGQGDVLLSNTGSLGEVLTLDPSEVEAYDSCSERVTTPVAGATRTAAPCSDKNFYDVKGAPAQAVAGQTTGEQRKGTRTIDPNISRSTKGVTASVPGFSLPFLSDTDQLMDVLTGEGEASYFRIDLGTLTASVAYQRRFGPIMAGPVPIVPFVGGSISLEGRLALGFDSYAQTRAVEGLSHPGAVDELITHYRERFDGGDAIREGFYVDDLDDEGEDVPEVKLVTTIEAGAGVSIGVVTAGLKGGVTLTINLDLNDPDDDGKLRTGEIRTMFGDNPACIFDVSADLEAFLAVFIEIELLFTSLEYAFDIVRLGPYRLFTYGCDDVDPTLVTGSGNELSLTSGDRFGARGDGTGDIADEYEVRQFDTGGGAAEGGTTEYEVSGAGRVQRVTVAAKQDGGYSVTIFKSGITLSTDDPDTYDTTGLPTFSAGGGEKDDQISFLTGETIDEEGALESTPFSTRVTSLSGGSGNDALVTGAGDDTGITGGEGDDSIDTGDGADKASGDAGNDVMDGGAGRDDLAGGDGNDSVSGGAGADRAAGGNGDDALVGGPGRDVRAVLVQPAGSTTEEVLEQARVGFDSGDVLVGGAGTDAVDGGDGSDIVVGGDESTLTGVGLGTLFESRDRSVDVLVRAVEGQTQPTNPEPRDVSLDTAKVPGPAVLDDLCDSGTATVASGDRDYVTGGDEADVVVGGNGADRLDGGPGPDEVCGRGGDDQASGDGAAGDRADGSDESDEESDADDADVIRGGHGDDQLDGGAGDDVVYGDDVRLVRGGTRVLDGSLGAGADGEGRDYLDGGSGGDVMAGGAGSDLVVGGDDDDQIHGEGAGTPARGGDAPSLRDRLLACNTTTRVVAGLVDLDGDLLAGAGGDQITPDDGQLSGLRVDDGVVLAQGSASGMDGLIGDVVVVGGRVDLDRDGDVDGADSGVVDLPSMLATAASNADGDCVLAGDGDDAASGGSGSDYVGAGDGRDLADGGDGNDLVLGDDGVDAVLGGDHHDVLVGGLDDDHLLGGDGDDRLRGNEGDDDLVGGSDVARTADGQDVLIGGDGTDVLSAENAQAVSAAIVDGIASAPWLTSAPASVRATSGELRYDDSALSCDGTEASRWLTLLPAPGNQTREPLPSPGTPLAYDELFGGYGCDWVFGSAGDDLVRGGQDDDVVEGGPGEDIAQGDDGDDVVLGGSSLDHTTTSQVTLSRSGEGAADDGDRVLGDGGPDGTGGDGADVLAGDNALPVRHEDGSWGVILRDVAGAAGAGDTMLGGELDDRVFGQAGADTIGGDGGDDLVEGNAGADTLSGGDGDDDLVGGSSSAEGVPFGERGVRLTDLLDAAPYDASADGVPDGGDTIEGDAGDDVVLGDNGRITRPDDRDRDIALAPAGGGDSGEDRIGGGDGVDRLFGQDGDDIIDGDAGDDHAEGNGEDDTVDGGEGSDAVVGGSSVSPAADLELGSLPTTRIVDGDDTLEGGADSDRLFGDNATVLAGSEGLIVQLADLAARDDATSGDDVITDESDTDADQVFGQSGDDTITTGDGSDYVEGNAGTDTVVSGDGDDDVLGGSSSSSGQPLGARGSRLTDTLGSTAGTVVDAGAAGLSDVGDDVDAGAGRDTVLGDNGRITRPSGSATRGVAMADTAPGATSGSDVIAGGSDDDVLYGQLDDGAATAWAAGDRLSGDAGLDALIGDLAVVTPTPAASLGRPSILAIRSEMVSEGVYAAGSTVPVTVVPTGLAEVGGPDLLLGGTDADVLRGGGGSDLASGDDADDVVFGGAGDDALWGGADDDRIFGGRGADDLDLKKRTGDPTAYDAARPLVDRDRDQATVNGADLVYGGWGPDELQADQGGAGRQPGTDVLVDWVGVHNIYYVCGGAYGAGRIVRESSPTMMDVLEGLTRAAGGLDVGTAGSGAWWDLGLVENRDRSSNTRKHPGAPGNFTCG